MRVISLVSVAVVTVRVSHVHQQAAAATATTAATAATVAGEVAADVSVSCRFGSELRTGGKRRKKERAGVQCPHPPPSSYRQHAIDEEEMGGEF